MIRREIRKLYLQTGTLFSSLSFFALSLFCIALTLGHKEDLLRQVIPAFLWILSTLTSLFSTPLFIKAEGQAGLLDEMMLHSLPLSYFILSKVMAETLLLGLPLIGMGGLLSFVLGLSSRDVLLLSLTLLMGFPALSSLGMLGGLLTLQARGGGLLITFLIVPFTLPLLLFSLSVLERAQLGLDSSSSFCLFTGVSLFLVVMSISAGSWAWRLVGEG